MQVVHSNAGAATRCAISTVCLLAGRGRGRPLVGVVAVERCLRPRAIRRRRSDACPRGRRAKCSGQWVGRAVRLDTVSEKPRGLFSLSPPRSGEYVSYPAGEWPYAHQHDGRIGQGQPSRTSRYRRVRASELKRITKNAPLFPAGQFNPMHIGNLETCRKPSAPARRYYPTDRF